MQFSIINNQFSLNYQLINVQLLKIDNCLPAEALAQAGKLVIVQPGGLK